MGRLVNMRVLARHLRTTSEQAAIFCHDVQAGFAQDPPTLTEIDDCLLAHPQMRQVPSIVAAVIRGDRGQRSKHPRPKRVEHEPSRNDWENDSDEIPVPLLNIQRYDPRKSTAGMPQCPHGVLKAKKCWICNREEFEAEYGEL